MAEALDLMEKYCEESPRLSAEFDANAKRIDAGPQRERNWNRTAKASDE